MLEPRTPDVVFTPLQEFGEEEPEEEGLESFDPVVRRVPPEKRLANRLELLVDFLRRDGALVIVKNPGDQMLSTSNPMTPRSTEIVVETEKPGAALSHHLLLSFPVQNLEMLQISGYRIERGRLPEAFSVQYGPVLKYLHLKKAGLDRIPMNIDQLKDLIELDLSENDLQVSEDIPRGRGAIDAFPSAMKNLKKLQILVLNGNRFSIIPRRITSIHPLLSLSMTDNAITEIPGHITKLRRIRILDLSGNRGIVEVPHGVGSNMPTLRTLLLSRTSIQWLPQSIWDSRSISTLDISRTRITAIPNEIVGMVALTKLYAGYNPNVTSVPAALGNLTKLQELSLPGCKITSLPGSLANLRDLDTLNLEDNPIALHTLEPHMEGWIRMRALVLDGVTEAYRRERPPEEQRGVQGVLPKTIGSMIMLQELHLERCLLRSLPEEISRLQTLFILSISDNPLGGIPTPVLTLRTLQVLYANNIQMHTLPERIQELVALRQLWIKQNNLSALPDSIRRMPALSLIDVRENRIGPVAVPTGIYPSLDILRDIV